MLVPEPTEARSRIAFALDYPSLELARQGARQVCGDVGVLKVGLELFTREGTRALALGDETGCSIFLDLKLHDIPETVERAVANACQLGVRYLTLHASGGPRMLQGAAQRVQKEGSDLTLLAVTVLTSLDESDLRAVGVDRSPREQTQQLAEMAKNQGISGLVCSVAEVQALRQQLGSEMVLVTPGIRSASAGDDQKRIGTPREAIRAGSSLLVVGRPIRDAADPRAAAADLRNQVAAALLG